jgi:LuxR family maltose regulon positive regulatory protein
VVDKGNDAQDGQWCGAGDHGGSAVYFTKAVPPCSDGLVQRPRLHRLLDDGVRGRFTAVIGPAGTGKSALLAGWVRSPAGPPGPLAWLSLDEGDNDPARLGAHLVAALEVGSTARRGAVPQWLPDHLRSASRAGPECLASALANALAELSEPLVLVLDDFHALRPGAARSALLGLIRHAPDQLRVVLAARREPDLGLHRLRATGGLVEVRGADLAFTHAEAGELFAKARIRLDPDALDGVLACSGGWAVALRAVVIARTENESWRNCLELRTRAGRLCSDFLTRELLNQMPPEDQDLLLRTSVADRLEPSLVRALTGRTDGARALRRLAAEHDLLLRDEGHVYRQHPLLRRTLALELADRATAAELAELHLAAQEWHASRERTDTALFDAIADGRADPIGPIPDGEYGSGQAQDGPVPRPAAAEDGERLTGCELEVLRLLPSRLTLDEIAADRHVSPNTVKSQVKGIYRKLGVRKRRGAVELGRRQGLL